MIQPDWLQLILLGGIMGAMGQGARVVIGLKKLNDEVGAQASAALATGDTPPKTSDSIDVSRLLVSLLIGFIAGALAALTLNLPVSGADTKPLFAFMAAGYAGTDFIEGIMSGYMPSTPPKPAPPKAGAADGADAPAATAAAGEFHG